MQGSRTGIQPSHADRLRLQLGRLDAAKVPEDMDLPGWHLHPLKGQYRGFWSIRVNRNWRLIFAFSGEDVVDVDYLDYH